MLGLKYYTYYMIYDTYYMIHVCLFLHILVHFDTCCLVVAGISLVRGKRRAGDSLRGAICDIGYIDMQCCRRCVAGRVNVPGLRK